MIFSDFLSYFVPDIFCDQSRPWAWKILPFKLIVQRGKQKSRKPTTDAYEAPIFGEELSEDSISVVNHQSSVSADPPFVPCGHTVEGGREEEEKRRL